MPKMFASDIKNIIEEKLLIPIELWKYIAETLNQKIIYDKDKITPEEYEAIQAVFRDAIAHFSDDLSDLLDNLYDNRDKLLDEMVDINSKNEDLPF